MRECWLRTNRRALALGMAPPAVIAVAAGTGLAWSVAIASLALWATSVPVTWGQVAAGAARLFEPHFRKYLFPDTRELHRPNVLSSPLLKHHMRHGSALYS